MTNKAPTKETRRRNRVGIAAAEINRTSTAPVPFFWARRVGGAISSMNSIAWAPFFEKGHPFEDRFLGGARTKKDTSRARRTDDTKTMKIP